jgi:hypothetical protein
MTNINPIQLDNIRVLSTTYEKLLCVISKEQADLLTEKNITIREQDSEEYGKSYLVVVKCASDKMCDLYKTIKRRDIVKGNYDIVGNVAPWEYNGTSGIRLDGFFITKLETVITPNPTLMSMLLGGPKVNPTPVVAPPVLKEIKRKAPAKQ